MVIDVDTFPVKTKNIVQLPTIFSIDIFAKRAYFNQLIKISVWINVWKETVNYYVNIYLPILTTNNYY